MTTARPGTASRISPGRATGRALRSCPVTVIWLAMVGGTAAPPAMFGAAETKGGGEACALAAAAGAVTGFAVCGLVCLAVTSMAGSCIVSTGATVGGVCAQALAPDNSSAADAMNRDAIDLPAPDPNPPAGQCGIRYDDVNKSAYRHGRDRTTRRAQQPPPRRMAKMEERMADTSGG